MTSPRWRTGNAVTFSRSPAMALSTEPPLGWPDPNAAATRGRWAAVRTSPTSSAW